MTAEIEPNEMGATSGQHLTLRRAIVVPAAIGTFAISVIVGVALAVVYLNDASARLDRDMSNAVQAVVRSATSAAWHVDRQAAELIIQGLANDPRVSRTGFEADAFETAIRGERVAGAKRFEMPLIHETEGRQENIGRIFVETNPEFIQAPLIGAAVESGLLLGGIVFAAALWVLLLLEYRVTRPILRLAAHAGQLARTKLSDVAPLDLRSVGQVREIQALGRTLEELRSGNLAALEALAERRRAALEAQQSKLDALTRMSGGVSHEFSNLLQPIVTLSTMGGKIATGQVAPERLAAYFRQINEAAIQATTIASDFLTFCGASRRPAEIGDLSAALRHALRTVQPILTDTGRIELAVEAGIRAGFDKVGLTQVLMNLVKNAVEAFGSQGQSERRLTVGVSLARNNGIIELRISDNGPGLTETVRARMFEPFFSTKGAQGGTGLGLAVVYGVISAWGGTIDTGNQPDGGAEFVITLPAADENIVTA